MCAIGAFHHIDVRRTAPMALVVPMCCAAHGRPLDEPRIVRTTGRASGPSAHSCRTKNKEGEA